MRLDRESGGVVRSAVAATTASIVKFAAARTGVITRIDLYSQTTNNNGDTTFDVNIDGTSIWAADQTKRVKILSGASSGYKADLQTIVTKGQWVTLDADTVPSGGIGAGLTLVVTVQDSIIYRPRAWYDVSQIHGFTDGVNIDFLEDLSGNNYYLYQTTSSARPSFQTNEQNGLPVLHFDGNDCLKRGNLLANDLFGMEQGTVFFVGRLDSADTEHFPFGFESGSAGINRVGWYVEAANVYFDFPNTSTGRLTNGSLPSGYMNNYHVFEFVRERSGTARMLTDGTQNSTTTLTGSLTSTAAGYFGIGAYVSNSGGESAGMTGDFCEQHVYNVGLTSTERAIKRAILGAKWGITVV